MSELPKTNREKAVPLRFRVEVRGLVQGVGFRPFVYACAKSCYLSGFTGNDDSGVFLEVEGSSQNLSAFLKLLAKTAPPLSQISSITSKEIPPVFDIGFHITESINNRGINTVVSPDVSVCDECVAELFAPDDRRFQYPFINCTNCGPRFTITKSLPYDRPQTTMNGFRMCRLCQAEYDDPDNRRFHAQPNACGECGPQLTFVAEDSDKISCGDALTAAREALLTGKILAVKGIGGYHLACDAKSDSAVQSLRKRKGRAGKPFALMCRNLATARRYTHIGLVEEEVLTGRESPIVLLRKRKGEEISEWIAPGIDLLGIFLPYSPLHHLLFNSSNRKTTNLDVLVMTSGNLSQEPIITDNNEALRKLSGIADAFLIHDRDILAPCDDSVIRISNDRELPIRRSRGYAPFPVALPFAIPPILAVGGDLKAVFCLAKDKSGFMSQHIGDMENLKTIEAFALSVKHLRELFNVDPQIVAVDKHPNYLSSLWAEKNLTELFQQGTKLIKVQHHHAHIASVMAENGLDGTEKVTGFAFDGTGYGDDGAIWGGEVLLADYEGYERAAHLTYIPLAGGDASVRKPYRMALAHLWQAGVEWANDLPCVAACSETEQKILLKQFENGFNTTATSSFGRLFDAVASIAGIRQNVNYEAQAAIEFEAVMDKNIRDAYEFDFIAGKKTEIDCGRLIKEVANDAADGVTAGTISAKFHNATAELILRLARQFREQHGINKTALSGGCFQNAALLEAAWALLIADGFEVFTHRLVPPNDGGIALGQAVIAGRRRQISDAANSNLSIE
ncbi:MAG: carbamoyltransferase HypF [Pyrinomonadaceae bacterium]